uniref:Uncharacterized protein n=1 Tax=Arundo donax TaxID=35708 RepID=A0A0A9H014_ARUDO
MLEHRAVVAQVERQVAARVHLHDGVGIVLAAADGRPALALAQVGGVAGVEGRVGAVVGAGVAVQAVGEGRAVGDADRVST